MSDFTRPSSGSGPHPWWLRVLLPIRQLLRPRPPSKPPTRTDDPVSLAQFDVVQRAFGKDGLGGDPDGTLGESYLSHPSRVLVMADDVPRLDEFFESDPTTYRGPGRVSDELVGDLRVYDLPALAGGGDPDLERTLAEVDSALGVGVARPDHVLYVTPKGIGRMCPAGEPRPPVGTQPIPRRNDNPTTGKGVRVSVVDTGWYAAAEKHPSTTWLQGNIEGDLEQVNPKNIHPYAGHGTFVAGVVRCMAPGVYIEIEGALTQGGAVYESNITKELNEAMTDTDKPDLISISAGCYSRQNLGLLGFEALSAFYGLAEGAEAVLVIAAAGNDANDRPFWPAAYDWVVGVGSVEENGSVSDFSNVGDWVDVYARGRDLVNAFPRGTYVCYEPPHEGERRDFDGLAEWSGTSFATPIVTGLIAAYMSEHQVPARDAKDAVVKSGTAFKDPRVGQARFVGPGIG